MGESEAAVRRVFVAARKNQPAIVFVDEVDSLAPKRGAGDGSEGRVVATLLTEMDGMDCISDDGSPVKVVVVAATNRPNAIDEALRRPGRFDREIEIGIPDVDSRKEILTLLMNELPFEGVEGKGKDEFVRNLAGRTHGFVGADLEALVRTGFTIGLKRLGVRNGQGEGGEEVVLREEDIESALKDVRPTAMREIFLEPPKVRWSDIGGQEEVKQRLREAVEWPLTVCISYFFANNTNKILHSTPKSLPVLVEPPEKASFFMAPPAVPKHSRQRRLPQKQVSILWLLRDPSSSVCMSASPNAQSGKCSERPELQARVSYFLTRLMR